MNALVFDREYATELAAALVETLDDARALAGFGASDPELVATTQRAHDLQVRFRALLGLTALAANDDLAAICISTDCIVTRLTRWIAGEPGR